MTENLKAILQWQNNLMFSCSRRVSEVIGFCPHACLPFKELPRKATVDWRSTKENRNKPSQDIVVVAILLFRKFNNRRFLRNFYLIQTKVRNHSAKENPKFIISPEENENSMLVFFSKHRLWVSFDAKNLNDENGSMMPTIWRDIVVIFLQL